MAGPAPMGDIFGPIPSEMRARLQPMPKGFTAAYTSRPGALVWRGNVVVETQGRRDTIACEVGARFEHDASPAVIQAAIDQLAAAVWHVKELARLGHVDGLRAARVDRHMGRPVSRPDVKRFAADEAVAKEVALDLAEGRRDPSDPSVLELVTPDAPPPISPLTT